MQVYGWTGWWNDSRNTNHHRQARFICLSPSKAAICRLLGIREGRYLEMVPTGNKTELAIATEPMIVWVRTLDQWDGPMYLYEKEPMFGQATKV